MYKHTYYYVYYIVLSLGVHSQKRYRQEESANIDVVDLSHPTTWKILANYFGSVEKNWKICINCGIPGIGTAMHLEHSSFEKGHGAMVPSLIPTEYLLTRLVIIDVSSMTKLVPNLVLTLDVALQWFVLKYDPREPTLLLFKFGWKEERVKTRSCVCKIPGISYELAEWIAENLTHVVGVATDAPTLESEQTREMTTRTVSNLLGRSGIYMIENVNLKRIIPDNGCMAIAMPLKLLASSYVPARLTAFCPQEKTALQVVLALKDRKNAPILPSRDTDVNLDEILY